MRTRVIMSALLCLAFLPGCGGSGGGNTRSIRFNITDLGPVPLGRAATINNAGQIAATVGPATSTAGVAALISGNHGAELGTLGGADSFATCINAKGQVVGASQIEGGEFQHAFLYANGKMQDLGTLGGLDSTALAINNAGQVVGQSQWTSDSLYQHAFLYSSGRLTDLGTLSGDTSSSANAVNDGGQIVGASSNGTAETRAFLYSQGVMRDLGTLGGHFTEANAINDNGQIVGQSSLGTASPDADAIFPEHAFLYSNGKMQDLGTLGGLNSSATAINLAGQVVGSSLLPGSQSYSHAFLYTNGKMVDLNTTIDAYSADGSTGWVLVAATGINATGQIVGYGRLQTQSHIFLLTPR